MKVSWLIENFEADNKIWKLIAEVKSRGLPLEVIDYYNFYLNNNVLDDNGMPSKSKFKDDDCVIFQGSIQAALWIKQNKPWVPGLWLDPHKFKCTTYYSYIGAHLFNADYQFTTVGEYKRKHKEFYKTFGIDNCIFIRPDTGMKSFTGQIFTLERHDTDWKFFDQTTKPEDILVIASPKHIKTEYRVIIAEGYAIAVSQYHREGKREQLPGAPTYVLRKAEEVAADLKTLDVAPMYTIDIAVDAENVPYVMEINCFNCSGMYECDKAVVVDAANRIAWAEYQSYHEVKP